MRSLAPLEKMDWQWVVARRFSLCAQNAVSTITTALRESDYRVDLGYDTSCCFGLW
ncbi:hypothetical protein DSM25558_2707 [Agrobacterium sp. DSM 25558]|uniref:hypothetical protein n=1 Tax=Agrobacterium sp. DSM 25558 TaxID=1907665 RepID=UPI0009724C4E|nr:hypothetical protein [Agrobacterium sp. DSM 25558]SCX20226.1 hypothetical protein DSM25558_2707 [Agrobacterium sp. DSM 25558]